MSPTSTSESTEHDRAFVRIATYFILRRGRGSALSSRDTDALETWSREGYAWTEILAAIERAFQISRTHPATLRACGRYLAARGHHGDDLLDPNILSGAFSTQPEDPPHERDDQDGAPHVQPAAVHRALAHLERAATHSTDPRARAGYLNLRQEITERAGSGPVPPETIALFDEALALLALEQLPKTERDALEATIQAAPTAMRTRTLLECVGRRLDLDYPNIGTQY